MAARKVLGLAFTVLVGVVAWAGPRLVVGPELFDFGEVSDGIVVQQVFILENAGDEPLQITRVGYNCGCTSYALTKWQLAPGERGELTVRFNTTGYSGSPQPVSQVVTVYSNDPAGAREIPIRGRVLPYSSSSAGASVEPEVPRASAREEVKAAPKPTLVNLQVDLVTPEDAEAVLPVLDLIESYGWYTTVYVTGQIALAYPKVVKEIHDRGHQIGVLGWEAGEDLLSMTEDELYDRLENAFLAVRAAVGEMRPAYIADFKPQGYCVNDTLLRVLSRLGVRSCTGTFPEGPSHAHHLDRFGLIAIPISTCKTTGRVLEDDLYITAGLAEETFFGDLELTYADARSVVQPVVAGIRPRTTVVALGNLGRVLELVAAGGDRVVVVDQVAARANPFIDWVTIVAPTTGVAGHKITVSVRYRANCWCPYYYFKIYACSDGAICDVPVVRACCWNEVWRPAAGFYVYVGEHEFSVELDLPVRQTDYEYRLMVVGQACHGGPCWPAFAALDASASAKVLVKAPTLSMLFVPVQWTSNNRTQADFDAYVNGVVNRLREAYGITGCPDVVLDHRVSVEQELTGEWCGSNWTSRLRSHVKSRGWDPDRYHVVVGVRPSKCGTTAGAQNGANIWISAETVAGGAPKYPEVLAHEIGHWFGLSDEYCSREAPVPSPCPNCNGSGDVNRLSATLGCDPQTSSCCFQTCSLRNCASGDSSCPCGGDNYFVCCYGTVATGGASDDGGSPRCIMSYLNAPSDSKGLRYFCTACQAHLQTRISCQLSGQTFVPLGGEIGEDTKRVVVVCLRLLADGTLFEDEPVAVRRGVPTPTMGADEGYRVEVMDFKGEVVWGDTYRVTFGYSGPVLLGESYEGGTSLFFWQEFHTDTGCIRSDWSVQRAGCCTSARFL